MTTPCVAAASPTCADNGGQCLGIKSLSTSEDVVAYKSSLPNGDAVYVWAPVEGANLPIVAFIHGSHTEPSMYTRYATILASQGFVIVAPEHKRELFGDFAHYPQQAFINWSVDFAAAENANSESPLAGRIDVSRVFLTGHSMGGGTALGIACNFGQPGLVVDEWSVPKELVAVVVNGTHNIPPPRTGEPLPVNNIVPIAFMQGSVDDVVTLDQAQRTFAVVAGQGPNAFIEIQGGNHFFLTDCDNPVGANPDRNPMTLDQTRSVEAAAHWTAVWFKASDKDPQAVASLNEGSNADYVKVSVS